MPLRKTRRKKGGGFLEWIGLSPSKVVPVAEEAPPQTTPNMPAEEPQPTPKIGMPAEEVPIDEGPPLVSSREKNSFLDDVLCLTHGTSLEFFEDMLQENRVTANPGDPPKQIAGYEERLNKGAFTSLVLTCNVGNNINPLCNFEVILVFSKKLLTKIPYHISNNWFGGMQFAPLKQGKPRGPFKTYGDVPAYLEDNSDTLCKGSHVKNELVFEEDIPLDYLLEVWICNLSKTTKQINVRQPDGTFKRTTYNNLPFNPAYTLEFAQQLLSASGKDHIPVKIIDTIPAVSDEKIKGGRKKRRLKTQRLLKKRKTRRQTFFA